MTIKSILCMAFLLGLASNVLSAAAAQKSLSNVKLGNAVAGAQVSSSNISVSRYTSPANSFSTNSYWIEAAQSTLLIDVQFLPAEAIEAQQMAERASLLKFKHALILHPNPDKFNGTHVL